MGFGYKVARFKAKTGVTQLFPFSCTHALRALVQCTHRAVCGWLIPGADRQRRPLPRSRSHNNMSVHPVLIELTDPRLQQCLLQPADCPTHASAVRRRAADRKTPSGFEKAASTNTRSCLSASLVIGLHHHLSTFHQVKEGRVINLDCCGCVCWVAATAGSSSSGQAGGSGL